LKLAARGRLSLPRMSVARRLWSCPGMKDAQPTRLKEELRVDAARGLVDGSSAVSLGWSIR